MLSLGACRSVARDHKSQEAALIDIGTSTKSDVLDKVGLPSRSDRVENDEHRPVERWLYLKGADWSSVTVSGPNGQNFTFVQDRTRGPRTDIAMIIEFSEDGIVRAVRPGPERK
jgi:hypothetical protein